MALIRDGRIIADSWRYLPESKPDSSESPELTLPIDLIVTFDQWREHRDALVQRNGRLGVLLRSDQPPSSISDDLNHFDLVALDFPKFTDGRAYSYARLLRDRLGFEGELRAVGNVLRDQLLFMVRCGFDTIQVENTDIAKAWVEALSEIDVFYQPAADQRRPVLHLRHQPNAVANWAY